MDGGIHIVVQVAQVFKDGSSGLRLGQLITDVLKGNALGECASVNAAHTVRIDGLIRDGGLCRAGLSVTLVLAENGIENMLNAIQAGVLTNSTKLRLEKLEAQQKELEVRIAEEKIAKPRLSENQIRFWLTRFRKLDPNVKSHRETLINTFVNAVYLYDEKVLITFNYKDGTKTIAFDEIAAKDAPEGNGSDLVNFAPPRERLCRNTRAFFFCTNRKLTQVGGFEQHRPPPSVPAAKKPLRGFSRCAARAIHPRPPNKKNPNLFPIGEGFGFFVFFGYDSNSHI